MACTASAAIPTISLQGHGDTGNGGEPAAASLDDLAAQVLSACTMSGFFYLTDVAEFADNLETQAWKAAESLFLDDGADARQQRMASRDRQGHTGYTALCVDGYTGPLALLTQRETWASWSRSNLNVARLSKNAC